jgi:S-methylmethionine-dependent homocysteine/selenocysteine methylase
MTDVDYRAMYLKVRDELAELQQREWVGLTVEETNEITWGKTIYEILELFEAKLKEKNT